MTIHPHAARHKERVDEIWRERHIVDTLHAGETKYYLNPRHAYAKRE